MQKGNGDTNEQVTAKRSENSNKGLKVKKLKKK